MKAARLVLGLIGIILALTMFFFGIRGVFVVASLNGFVPGDLADATNYGVIIAPMFLIGAIIMVACNRRGILGGCIACTILFILCAAIGLEGMNKMDFTSGWMIVIAIYLFLSVVGIILNAVFRIAYIMGIRL